ncbi:MAG: hypothetical protein O6913_00540 [Chloroflexi bacterium]|nr:hypothetical protein [Chloroflexota bacterium]
MTRWTKHDRAKALAALEMNQGNVAMTAREVAVPRATITMWRDRAIEQGQALPLPADRQTDWKAVREEAGQLFLANARTAAEIVRVGLEKLQGQDLKVGDLQRVAVITGIMSDKSYDLLVGRRNADFAVSIDARSVHLPALEALSTDELRALIAREAARQEAAAEAAMDAPIPIRPAIQTGGPGA